MTAAVEQHVDIPIPVARHHDGLPEERVALVVAGMRHLAGMSHEQPGALEDAAHLLLEDLGVHVDAAMYPVALD
jgi:hypothetical protein